MYKLPKEYKHLRGNLFSEIRENFTEEVTFALGPKRRKLHHAENQRKGQNSTMKGKALRMPDDLRSC